MIPVVDIAAFLADETSPDALGFVHELTTACHEIGFVQLTGHGVDAALERRVHDVSRQFFALPEPDRLEIANTNTPYFRGYTRLGMEHTNGISDWRDQIDIGPEHEPVEAGPDDPAWLRLRGPNQWPSAVPELRPVVTEWMAQMDTVGQAVMRALAIGLGQPPDLFESVVTPDPEVLVKIIRYPAQDAASDTGQGVGPHHDSGLLSFILQDDVGGLEVLVGEDFVARPEHRRRVRAQPRRDAAAGDARLPARDASPRRVAAARRRADLGRLLLQSLHGIDARPDRSPTGARGEGDRRPEPQPRRSGVRDVRRQLAQVPDPLASRRRRHPSSGSDTPNLIVRT